MPLKKASNAKPRKESSRSRAASKPKVPPKSKSKPKAKNQRASRSAPSLPSEVDFESNFAKEVPIWDQGLRSQGARERSRPKISRSSFYQVATEEDIERQASGLKSESNRGTWGTTSRDPIEGVKHIKRKARGRGLFGQVNDAEDNYTAMMDAGRRAIVPNSPSRSPILRISLECREEIYSYLLLYGKSILVQSDWSTIEGRSIVSHAIILVCKQFAMEASAYLYRYNIIQSVLRRQLGHRRVETQIIKTAFLSQFRNLVLDCTRDCWDLDWYERATQGIESLLKANATIESFTMITRPQRVGYSSTALGAESNPVTFSDFLWVEGPFMTAIRKLAPKIFKVVVKKSTITTQHGALQFVISLDLSCLKGSFKENSGIMANEETLKLRRERDLRVEEQLRGLKERFESVFLDDEKAVKDSLCEKVESADRIRDFSSCSPSLGGGSSTFASFASSSFASGSNMTASTTAASPATSFTASFSSTPATSFSATFSPPRCGIMMTLNSPLDHTSMEAAGTSGLAIQPFSSS